MKCILCRSQNLARLQQVRASDLIALYGKMGVCVEHILKGDLEYYQCKDCDVKFFALKNGEIPTGDDEFYTSLIKNSWYYMSEKNEYEFAKQFVKAGARVLEVGCGAGIFGKSLKGKAEYVGLEFSSKAKELAMENGVEIHNILVQDFVAQNPKHTKGFDVACSFQVLEHTADPHLFIKSQIDCLNANWGGAAEVKVA